MSILGKILGGIWDRAKAGPGHKPQKQPDVVTPTSAPMTTPAQPQIVAQAPQPAGQAVDVAGILDFMNDQRDQKLNWRTSIVDLMKLVGLESSLSERKELADELGYTGDKSDSAAMNIWLHKQVLKKIVDNGGQLPTDMTP